MNEQEMTIALPRELENLKLPDPMLLNYYKNLNDRVIWLDMGIDESIIEISRIILRYNADDKDVPVEKRKPIKLMIYSYGGDANVCFHLIDIILMSKTPVYTYNMGVAMSAGFLILLAGHKRYCLKNSTALAHSGSGGAAGSFEQAEAQMQDYKKSVEKMREYILARTKIDIKTFNKNKSKEWYMYPEDQIKYGVCDEIVEDIDALL